MPNCKRALLALTTGDPAGIGPDISIALVQRELAGDVVLLGDRRVLETRAAELGYPLKLPDYDATQQQRTSLQHVDMLGPASAGAPDVKHVQGILNSLTLAARMASAGECAAVVTAPVAKSLLARVAPQFRGHTEFFADATDTQLAVMAMIGPSVKVVLVTTHVPLAAVPEAITAERVCSTLFVAEQGMRKLLRKESVSWLVCGLNPHAGEDGMLGVEEQRAIIPGLQNARAQGIKAQGPVAADTAFLPEKLQQFDCILAMYHDQALPVAKRDAFTSTVNVTFGLPFVRTSVDHGTAFELAASGAAQVEPLQAAFDLAVQMVAER